ncbi:MULTISPECIES: Hsp70 family protein [Thiorhodovibrio]|uniref:Hsp70 family protein n=1 Tax=Thiorhodovibrio TaxID=61593 RepID=UPI001914128A|nr:Hsp70 family protein [Thiorhodovibrio litoralis]WPL11048.1 Heat shock protein 70 [Thiorhodovibrio litoralis]
MTRYCAGIDLGTTNTVLSVWQSNSSSPEVVPIFQPVDDFPPAGSRSLPLLDSVVTFFDGRVYVGAFSRQLALIKGAQTLASVKRYMGRHWFRTFGGVGWTPERVSACILKIVHDQLIRSYGQAPERVVVTIPACFGTEARRATLTAAAMAGFEPTTLSLFDEPTAALLSELHSAGVPNDKSKHDLHAVIDIGGGTLDVSLVRMHREANQTIFDVVGQSRYNEIAGDDFDLNIAGLLLNRFEKQFGSLDSLITSDPDRTYLCWLFLQKARDLKHRLSDVLSNEPAGRWAAISESVYVSELGYVPEWRTEFSGTDLRDALQEYFPRVDDPDARRSELGFFRPIQESLDTASVHEKLELGPLDVTKVWMAGGSATLPPVKLALHHIFCREPTMIRDPMFAVALGAAWKAGLDAGYGDGRFDVRERIFDGIFLKVTRDKFRELVPLRQEVPMPPTEHPSLILMPRPDNRLELELYLGTQATTEESEPDLSPLARRVVTFPEILPAQTPISLTVELTDDQELRLDLSANTGRLIRGDVSVGTAPGWDVTGTGHQLPPLNEPGAPV